MKKYIHFCETHKIMNRVSIINSKELQTLKDMNDYVFVNFGNVSNMLVIN